MSGEYTITVYAPNIVVASADAGTVNEDIDTVTLDVTVDNKGGGGRPGDVQPGQGGGGGGGRRSN